MPEVVRAIRFRTRLVLTTVALVVLIVVANLIAKELAATLSFEIRPSNEDMVHRVLMTMSIVYALLIAIPFVPGIEIGLAMLAMLGPVVVLLVYLCTIAGLSLSFLAGRLIPLATLGRFFAELNMQRASDLMLRALVKINLPTGASRRPAGKAREGRIVALFNRRATQPAGMDRRSSW